MFALKTYKAAAKTKQKLADEAVTKFFVDTTKLSNITIVAITNAFNVAKTTQAKQSIANTASMHRENVNRILTAAEVAKQGTKVK
jgi:hypothetical protein